MSQRLQIVLPDPVLTCLQELATGAGEPLATFAARIVRDAPSGTDGKAIAPKALPSVHASAGPRPRWLEHPYGGDPAWRQEMWGAIVALHGRYPRRVEHLKDGWWNDEGQTETLCALAVWRAEIDNMGRDPREELAFQHQLADFAHALRQQGGWVTKTWQPGPPPQEWTGSLP